MQRLSLVVNRVYGVAIKQDMASQIPLICLDGEEGWERGQSVLDILKGSCTSVLPGTIVSQLPVSSDVITKLRFLYQARREKYLSNWT